MGNNIISIQRPAKKYVGIDDLAAYLTISVNTIRSWVWQRQIPYFKVGRLVRFDIQEVEAWLQRRKMNIINYDRNE